MSLFDAFSKYSALGPEQRAILASKKASGTHTPSEWIEMLGGLASADRSGDGLRRALGWAIAIGFVGAFVVGVTIHSLIAALVLLAVAIVSVILFIRMKRQDLPNNMRESILPLVALLREDMLPDAGLFLQFDLSGGCRAEKKTGSRQIPAGRTMGGTETSYRDTWLEGKGTLADGSTAEWCVTDLIRERQVTKRSSSGKIKTKVKRKVRRVLDVRVGLRGEDYALVAAPAAGGRGHDRVSVKEGEKRNVMKLRRITNGTNVDAPLDPRNIFDLLAEAYRRVTLNKTEE